MFRCGSARSCFTYTHGQAAAFFASRSRALSVIEILPVVLSGTKLEAFSSNRGSRETGLLRIECLHVSYIEDRHAQMCQERLLHVKIHFAF